MQQKSNCKYISKNFCTLSTCEHYNGYCVGENGCSCFIKSTNKTIIVQNPHNSRNEEYISGRKRSVSKTVIYKQNPNNLDSKSKNDNDFFRK